MTEIPAHGTDTERYLSRALHLAGEAAGGVSPRPSVGAVIVKEGRVAGEGLTEPRPGMHAEVAAIRQAGEASRGATMYCTLEPHAHQGVSPPCTEEIISAGIARVVCPIEDPNPQVNGNGFRRLRSAGVEVVTDVPAAIREQAEEIVSGFAMLVATGRPQFTMKYAMSIDGKIATAGGESQWITGVEARAEAHRLRHASDAVVTGIGTVLTDNPRLTARNSDGAATGRPRLRVVLDTHGRMPPDAALLKERGDVLWVRGEGAAVSQLTETSGHVEVVELPVTGSGIDVAALAKLLGDRGCCDVLVEAGGKLAGAFAAAGLIDRVAAFVGAVVIGGEHAPGPVGGEGFERLADALRLERVSVKRLGDDILVTGRVAKAARTARPAR
ncbi:MAG: bifunctional diaminohydroxyphosphoribosylaminopyrimidine deaminase/5-amino-6-(5-phosphoribosylamino)uracil reductase RibD [Chloroflexi bacterium]|nr:bifunctional diaminohydroxyphosphoribosylaminopyrimidine deaminase/5-amino-6-(5-phosphoribosylamino)uracil reductase RibD [Chloroflexota bacterium]